MHLNAINAREPRYDSLGIPSSSTPLVRIDSFQLRAKLWPPTQFQICISRLKITLPRAYPIYLCQQAGVHTSLAQDTNQIYSDEETSLTTTPYKQTIYNSSFEVHIIRKCLVHPSAFAGSRRVQLINSLDYDTVICRHVILITQYNIVVQLTNIYIYR